MAESCKTNCPVWLLSKGHVACSPMVRRVVEDQVLGYIDENETKAAEAGPLAATVIDEVERNIERLDRRLEQDAAECEGPIVANLRGKLVLQCGGVR